ncbi:MAG: TAXI family TRAP transporter solute-binding subunit, partial [Chloroflexota bacterium]
GTGVSFKLQPEGTELSRMAIMKAGDVQFGNITGTEMAPAFFGRQTFDVEGWGPQPVRIAWLGGPNPAGFAVRGDSGIKTPNDLRGKKVASYDTYAMVQGHMEGVLAFAGLTWNDVIRVPVGGTQQARQAVLDGAADTAFFPTGNSQAYQLEASSHGIGWIDFPAADIEGWKRLQEHSPALVPMVITSGPGITPAKPVNGITYDLVLATWETQDPQMVYWMVKQLDQYFNDFKDTVAGLEYWNIGYALDPTHLIAPYHDGSIQYFKEIGKWTPALEKKQQSLLTQFTQARADWEKAHPGW